MRMVGLAESAYWASYQLVFACTSLLAAVLAASAGLLTEIRPLRRTDFSLLVSVYFVFYFVMSMMGCFFSSVRALPGRLSDLSVSHSKSILYGALVWARRALNRPKRRFPVRAVCLAACHRQPYLLRAVFDGGDAVAVFRTQPGVHRHLLLAGQVSNALSHHNNNGVQ